MAVVAEVHQELDEERESDDQTVPRRSVLRDERGVIVIGHDGVQHKVEGVVCGVGAQVQRVAGRFAASDLTTAAARPPPAGPRERL